MYFYTFAEERLNGMVEPKSIYDIVVRSVCLRTDQMEGYLKGELFVEEERVVEAHLATCPLCQDAIDGLEEQGAGLLQQIPTLKLSKFKKQDSEEASNPKEDNTLVANLHKRIPNSNFNQQLDLKYTHERNYAWVGILSVILLVGAGGFLFWQYQNNRPTEEIFKIQKPQNLTENESYSEFPDFGPNDTLESISANATSKDGSTTVNLGQGQENSGAAVATDSASQDLGVEDSTDLQKLATDSLDIQKNKGQQPNAKPKQNSASDNKSTASGAIKKPLNKQSIDAKLSKQYDSSNHEWVKKTEEGQ